MTRCDYDAVFYRVFCITLLAIAFTFTVILTNVFIDIDGLLSNKQGKHKAHIYSNDDETHEEVTLEPVGNDYNNYGYNDDSFRTKRSIESRNILFHIQDPKLKNILTNRLSHLLEELDAEESNHVKSNKVLNLSKEKTNTPVLNVINERKDDEERVKKQKDDDILHLTMHNILLQGIIGHMNMNDVHKRMDSLMHNLDNKDSHKEYISIPKQEYMEVVTTIKPETKRISKLIKYPEPKEPTEKNPENNNTRKTTSDDQSFKLIDSRTGQFETSAGDNIAMMKPTIIAPGPNTNNRIGSKIFVKTVIDIKSVGNDRNDTMPKDPIQGIMELVLNGKSIIFTRPEVEINQDIQKKPTLNIKQPKPKIDVHLLETTTHADLNKISIKDLKNIPKDYLNRFVVEYFKQFPKGIEVSTDGTKLKNVTKRLKRHVKVKNKKSDKVSKPLKKVHAKKSPDDDDLYVEIETHYDSKSMKGDKKKKLINSLIEKIQKAINSIDINKQDKKVVKKIPDLLQVRKRQQNPLEYTDKIMVNKISIPMNSMAQRQLDPITIPKTIPKQDSSISVHDQSGYSWSKKYLGPAFLAGSKTINSAEMSELDVDYKNVMKTNGIPQRLQKPLNTDMSEETMNPNSFYDIGNMKFLVKDIDGSGFIAFNQYLDDLPEPEGMQFFTGVDKVIDSYQQNADQREQNMNLNWTNNDKQNATFNKNDHIIVRRSIKHKHDYHSNEYKIIYDGNALPYDNYRDIYQKEKTKTNIEMYNKFGELPLVLDDNIFNKNLKPAEIFGLANMFRRKKRSLTTRKITNLRNKIKLNKFMNAVSSRSIVLNKKRKKRQINKIRIIASDYPHKHSSDENVFVISDDENVFADRAIIKEVDKPELQHEEPEDTEILPYHSDVEYDVPTYRIFDGKSRQNALMSKYPHVFMEEITRSREEISPESTFLFHKIPSVTKSNAQADVEKTDDKGSRDLGNTMRSNTEKITEQTKKPQKVEDIVNALESPKTKYKVTLKIKPKNSTGDVHGGFKEIHTSINKSFNKNGLQYLSLVNVSEISKVFQLNKTKDLKEYYNKADDDILTQKINDQQDKMQLLLREHQKNIDEQLNRLNEEKVKIESILVDDNNTIIPHCDYLERLLKKVIYKEEDDKLLRNNEPTTTTTTTPAPTTTTLAPTTTVAPTTTTVAPTTTTLLTITTHSSIADKLKKKILHTIERNENLTDQILKKIDKNTELLQTFLKKLTDRVETKLTDYKSVHDEKAEQIFPKLDSFNSFSDWRFRQSPIPIHPNYFMRRNDSHVIPFVYAYQQLLSNHKVNPPPVANIIYQGHIHTKNIINDKEKINPVPNVIDLNNQTRFFIDEIESDYKVIPMNNVKINKMSKNTTIML